MREITKELVVSMSQKTKSSSIVYDWHRQDARITECEDVACTVNSNYGTGGGITCR